MAGGGNSTGPESKRAACVVVETMVAVEVGGSLLKGRARKSWRITLRKFEVG